jgi:hypothetical protein
MADRAHCGNAAVSAAEDAALIRNGPAGEQQSRAAAWPPASGRRRLCFNENARGSMVFNRLLPSHFYDVWEQFPLFSIFKVGRA